MCEEEGGDDTGDDRAGKHCGTREPIRYRGSLLSMHLVCLSNSAKEAKEEKEDRELAWMESNEPPIMTQKNKSCQKSNE